MDIPLSSSTLSESSSRGSPSVQTSSTMPTTLVDRCECPRCTTGISTIQHSDPSHDQRLHQNIPVHIEDMDNQQHTVIEIQVEGGSTKCARVMVDYFQKVQQTAVRNKIVLEVGSGTGLVGMAMARLGARHVIMTDQKPMMEVLAYNVGKNEQRSSFENKITLKPFFWGEGIASIIEEVTHRRTLDVVVGSDLIFAHEGIEPLVKAYAEAAPEHAITECYLAYIARFEWEKRFFSGMTDEGFSSAIVHSEGDIEIWKFVRNPASL